MGYKRRRFGDASYSLNERDLKKGCRQNGRLPDKPAKPRIGVIVNGVLGDIQIEKGEKAARTLHGCRDLIAECGDPTA
jgi:hypothetical protein